MRNLLIFLLLISSAFTNASGGGGGGGGGGGKYSSESEERNGGRWSNGTLYLAMDEYNFNIRGDVNICCEGVYHQLALFFITPNGRPNSCWNYNLNFQLPLVRKKFVYGETIESCGKEVEPYLDYKRGRNLNSLMMTM